MVSSGLTGNALTDVLPAGDAAGAALQYRMLSSAGLNAESAAGGMAASSLLGVGGLLALRLLAQAGTYRGRSAWAWFTQPRFVWRLVLFVLGGIVSVTTDKPLTWAGRALEWAWNHLPRQRYPVTDLGERVLTERDSTCSWLSRRSWRAAVIGGRLGFD